MAQTGVVGVVEFGEPPYRKVWDGYDWIWREDSEFRVVDSHPEPGKWMPAPEVPESSLKAGEQVPDDVWPEIREAMLNDREWP